MSREVFISFHDSLLTVLLLLLAVGIRFFVLFCVILCHAGVASQTTLSYFQSKFSELEQKSCITVCLDIHNPAKIFPIVESSSTSFVPDDAPGNIRKIRLHRCEIISFVDGVSTLADLFTFGMSHSSNTLSVVDVDGIDRCSVFDRENHELEFQRICPALREFIVCMRGTEDAVMKLKQSMGGTALLHMFRPSKYIGNDRLVSFLAESAASFFDRVLQFYPSNLVEYSPFHNLVDESEFLIRTKFFARIRSLLDGWLPGDTLSPELQSGNLTCVSRIYLLLCFPFLL